jgi:hypothetical protein
MSKSHLSSVYANFNDTDTEANFNDKATADAYADAYGGTIEARGVAYTVTGSDHKRARDDASSYRKGETPKGDDTEVPAGAAVADKPKGDASK